MNNKTQLKDFKGTKDNYYFKVYGNKLYTYKGV